MNPRHTHREQVAERLRALAEWLTADSDPIAGEAEHITALDFYRLGDALQIEAKGAADFARIYSGRVA